ncbi:hypothetical protein GALMADRAFT_133541 [Galerina marginata CBS 339.88]|uniref:Protein kinase domain-containing protein n=1 Tax=Galerina marginata (strain CBS 339.88) TaxID=685588 RepID=A0A067TLT7_GALM3|nr:hypothetical protein GALMADRAFT_133541 [Galerina marginata CBS 339.88]
MFIESLPFPSSRKPAALVTDDPSSEAAPNLTSEIGLQLQPKAYTVQPFRDLTNDRNHGMVSSTNEEKVPRLLAEEDSPSKHSKAYQDSLTLSTTLSDDLSSSVDLEPSKVGSTSLLNVARIGMATVSGLGPHKNTLPSSAPPPASHCVGESEGRAVDTAFTPPWKKTSADDLTGAIIRDGTYPTSGGGYADVYRGMILKDGVTTKVAIKVIRSHTFSEEKQHKIDKRLRREIRVWSFLQHQNIVPLLGTTMDFSSYVAMVCPWIIDGNLHNYLNDQKAELNLGRRLQILIDVAEGLAYLHAKSIIHGDLTTANILIENGKALLTDFGLSNVVAEFRTTSFISSTVAGAPRWAAPELFPFGDDAGKIPEVTKRCDIYSFGSVTLQVISGRIPYENIRHDMRVLMELMNGTYPPRPSEPLLSNDFWNFIVICWNQRPGIDEVRRKLQLLRDSCSDEALAANVYK